MPNLAFYPWLKRGVGASLDRRAHDPPPPIPDRKRRPEVTVSFSVQTNTGLPKNGSLALALVGPGDIAGLDVRVIARTWPKPDVSDAETGFFPCVEFTEPDLPWRYTPARVAPDDPPGTPANRLPPWFALVVLRDSEFSLDPPRPSMARPALPILEVTSAPGEILPKL